VPFRAKVKIGGVFWTFKPSKIILTILIYKNKGLRVDKE